jgi:hypothetical protein
MRYGSRQQGIAIPASRGCGCQVPRASRALAWISLAAFHMVSSPGTSRPPSEICPRGRRLASGRLLLAKHPISRDHARNNLVNKTPRAGPTCRPRSPECSHGATPVRCPGRRGLIGIEVAQSPKSTIGLIRSGPRRVGAGVRRRIDPRPARCGTSAPALRTQRSGGREECPCHQRRNCRRSMARVGRPKGKARRCELAAPTGCRRDGLSPASTLWLVRDGCAAHMAGCSAAQAARTPCAGRSAR